MNELNYQYLVLLFLLVIFVSCKKEKMSKKPMLSKKVIEIENKTKELDIYGITDSLLLKQFGKKNRFIDFKKDSKVKPYHFKFFYQLGLKNIRSYLSPIFNKPYISKSYDNYTLFIFEYENSVFSEKAFMQYNNDNERILKMIEKNEWRLDFRKMNKVSKSDERARAISSFCKSGGTIFCKGKYIFSIVKSCNMPLTINKMNWKEYENIFLELYLKEATHKILILNAGCGARNYDKEYF